MNPAVSAIDLPTKKTPTTYTDAEERLNTLSHGLGLLLSIWGLVLMIMKADGLVAVASVSVYGGTLILMFLASTIYHGIKNDKAKSILKLVDHSAIYLLIAGTYTPILLLSFDGFLSISSTVFIWSLAVFGVSFKLITKGRFPKIGLATYLAMGWFAIALIYPLLQAVPHGGLWWLLVGGLFFSIGVIFYVAKHKKYTHAVWHLFVMGGCASHFMTIYFFVI